MARFFKIGLIVTGQGEEKFLPALLRALTTAGNCHFAVLRRIGQRSPVTSQARQLQMVGRGQRIPTKDESEIGLPARRFLERETNGLVVLVDDLEGARRESRRALFRRYRQPLDVMLGPHYLRASVHFLVNMLEAYYFADPATVRQVLHGMLKGGRAWPGEGLDVEEIRHPKNDLKAIAPGFDEVKHGAQIVAQLDLETVLARSETCGSLRALVAWCLMKTGSPGATAFA